MSDQVAYTKPTSPYPGYINFTKTETGVCITIRGDGSESGACQPTVSLDLTVEEMEKFLAQAEAAAL